MRAVDGVSFTIRPGETFGLVGESGCGKSTLARIVAGLMTPSGGVIRFGSGGEAKPRIQMIFQDPFSSLNARWSVGRIIAEPIRVHGLRRPEEIRDRVGELLTQVGLSPADAAKYPQEFSGGQCQRISIARALAGEPEFLILDEPTSALDVSVQAQILTLLRDLQARFGFASLFITHNLAVVRLIAQRTAVMYLGQIVEMNETEALFSHPRHPYTRMLIDAAPDLDLSDRELRPIEGEVTAGVIEPGLCRFEPRCPWARDDCRRTPCAEFRDGEGSYRCLYPL
nr:ABC transporter ATP-binding protein [Alsobacter ponti]